MRFIFAGSLVFVAGAAAASDAPIYAPPPAWVTSADIAAASARATTPIIIQDQQVRIEGARVTSYVDIAVKLSTPISLTQTNTLSVNWLPDKGDLVINRAQLVRGGQTIDLLGAAKFTVLRREQGLEQRSLTGILTATMPVAGAQIGDILRLSYTIDAADAVLRGNAQNIMGLSRGSFTPGVGRARLSWPQGRSIAVAAGPDIVLPTVKVVGGFNQVELALPLAPAGELPGDAPARYRRPAQISATSFASWEDVSRTMAPLFITDGTIAEDGPIAAEVTRISAATSDPLQRTAQILALVQDRISYLANGMNGGNYVPQTPAQTWASRSGDCKAKSLLLAAMLRRAGIAAETVLVNASGGGDGVAAGPVMPGAFDHIIVKADIAGKALWLDGTLIGTRAETLEDVPDFRSGLPLRPAGAGLLALNAAAPSMPMTVVTRHIDTSAGIDFPALQDVVIQVRGSGAALLQQFAVLPPSKERNDLLDGMITEVAGDSSIILRDLKYDAATGIATLTARGMIGSPWDRSAKRAALVPHLASTDLTFEANRSRAAWQQIPVRLPENQNAETTLTYDLPDGGNGFTGEGGMLNASGAGVTVVRSAAITNGRLVVHESVRASGGEIAPADIPAERARFAALKAAKLTVKAPATAIRRWEVRAAKDRARLKPLEDTYATLIANATDKTSFYVGRASFYAGISDYRAAQADLDQAITLDATASSYIARALNHKAVGNFAAALGDLRKAQEIEPGAEITASVAEIMGLSGQAQAALPLIDAALQQDSDAKASLVATRAELLARVGRKDEGLAALSDLLADRPGDPQLLNAKCWFEAIWNHALDRAAADCDAAVQASQYAASVLDSRAVAHLKLGRLDAALADTNAALGKAGGQTQTLYVRGIVRKRMNDPAGVVDIAEALRRRPGLGAEYAAYGIAP